MGKTLVHLKNININDEWETPVDVLIRACKKYRIKPTLDVAATETNAKFPRYYTKKGAASPQDALGLPWNEPFFCNPPYSMVGKFIEKAIRESTKHNVPGLILTYAKTDTKWWHRYVNEKLEYHFVQGRIQFHINGVRPRRCADCDITYFDEMTTCPNCDAKLDINSATYPSVWIVLRKKRRKK